MSDLLDLALRAAAEAGELILEVYRSGDMDVRSKEDRSPLTRADLAADGRILEILRRSGLPCVTEETCPPYRERRAWKRLWMIDPLDGTKDFIAKNGEFTVNIALIEGERPVLGVVLAPALGLLYYAREGMGAFKREGQSEPQTIRNERRGPARTAAESRFHGGPDLDEFCARHGIVERRAYGSALKFGKIAEGEVDVYPRLAGSKEWDIAAGHRIAVEAGCRVVSLETGSEPWYNKPELSNPPFLVVGRGTTVDQFKF